MFSPPIRLDSLDLRGSDEIALRLLDHVGARPADRDAAVACWERIQLGRTRRASREMNWLGLTWRTRDVTCLGRIGHRLI